MTSKTTRMIMNVCSFCITLAILPVFIKHTYPLLKAPDIGDVLTYLVIVAAAGLVCILIGSILGIIMASVFKLIFKNTIFKDIL